MAIKGSKSRNTKAKGTKGNPTRTKVKTRNVSPQQVSKYKNDATKATSKAILAVQAVTGTGPRSTIGSLKIKTKAGSLGKRSQGPTFTTTTTRGATLRSTLKVVKRKKR
jgi:hypothetical protein